MAFKDLIIGVVLTGLFAIALITFGIQIASDNNAVNSLANESIIASFNASLQDNLRSIRQDTQTERESLEGQEAQGGDEGFSLTTIPSILLNFITLMFKTFKLILDMLSQVIGVPPIVSGVLIGSLTITAMILFWRVVKAGGT